MSDQRNLILAVVLSIGIILVFQYFYEIPRLQQEQARLEREAAMQSNDDGTLKPVPTGNATLPLPNGAQPQPSTADVVTEGPRLHIDNGRPARLP